MDVNRLEAEWLEPSEFEKYLDGGLSGSLQESWRDCKRCSLSAVRRGLPVFGKGNMKSPEIMFIGQSPGGKEEKEGKPFVGPSGNLLDTVLWMLHMESKDYYYTNVVGCRPRKAPNDDEERDITGVEIRTCMERLHQEIYHVDPLMIVSLGAVAGHALGGKGRTGDFVDIKIPSRIRGNLIYPLMQTHHPAAILRKIDFREGALPTIDSPYECFHADEHDLYRQFVGDLIKADTAAQYVRAKYVKATHVPQAVREFTICSLKEYRHPEDEP